MVNGKTFHSRSDTAIGTFCFCINAWSIIRKLLMRFILLRARFQTFTAAHVMLAAQKAPFAISHNFRPNSIERFGSGLKGESNPTSVAIERANSLQSAVCHEAEFKNDGLLPLSDN